ncbi:MAG: hypothetical protein KAR11_02815 [Phycisphaerae bacterium]|nr:hypothetical protein [Phycisphaerae bacterium]
MASFKMNLATIEGCPDPKTLSDAMEEYGLPDDEEFGVLNCSPGDQALYGTIIRKTNQAIQRLDPETHDVATTAVEKVTVYPLGVFTQRKVLEVYEGSTTGIEQVGAFFASALALPTVVTPIELDIVSTIEKLQKNTQRFQLRSVRISDYAHNSYMAGPYAPKFLDSDHGADFLAEYADFVASASVRFHGPHGRVTLNLTPKACFRYSLSNEDDKPAVQAILRKLI